MTTEDDFQAALDADPSDWLTRLMFADWLQEHDDPRADLRTMETGPVLAQFPGWCPI